MTIMMGLSCSSGQTEQRGKNLRPQHGKEIQKGM